MAEYRLAPAVVLRSAGAAFVLLAVAVLALGVVAAAGRLELPGGRRGRRPRAAGRGRRRLVGGRRGRTSSGWTPSGTRCGWCGAPA